MPPPQEGNNEDFVDKMFGGIRYEISGGLFEQADSVFHKGVSHAPEGNIPDWFTRMRRQVAPRGPRSFAQGGNSGNYALAVFRRPRRFRQC